MDGRARLIPERPGPHRPALPFSSVRTPAEANLQFQLKPPSPGELWWGDPNAWPKGNSQFIFLAAALDDVGKALCPGEWDGGEAKKVAATDFAELRRMADYQSPRPAPPPPIRTVREWSSPPLARGAWQDRKNQNWHVKTRQAWLRAELGARLLEDALALRSRLNRAVDWIAEQGAEDGGLVTMARPVPGGEYFGLPRSVWGLEDVWFRRFENRCAIKWGGSEVYLFLTRESLARCLAAIPKPKRPAPGACYHDADLALMPEMTELIDAGERPYPAALALADKAAGGGTAESKARRLVAFWKTWKAG